MSRGTNRLHVPQSVTSPTCPAALPCALCLLAAFRGMVEETARHTHSSGSGGVQRTKSAKAVMQAVRGRLASASPVPPEK